MPECQARLQRRTRAATGGRRPGRAAFANQLILLRELDAVPTAKGVQVGTGDKFQGREAVAVFFTMTTSSAADMHRSAEFLFSRNRFNVAVSRARCLTYLVCTERRLNRSGRDVEETRLISTLCAFAEEAGRETGTAP